MKKVVCLLLCVVMISAFSIGVFAEESFDNSAAITKIVTLFKDFKAANKNGGYFVFTEENINLGTNMLSSLDFEITDEMIKKVETTLPQIQEIIESSENAISSFNDLPVEDYAKCSTLVKECAAAFDFEAYNDAEGKELVFKRISTDETTKVSVDLIKTGNIIKKTNTEFNFAPMATVAIVIFGLAFVCGIFAIVDRKKNAFSN